MERAAIFPGTFDPFTIGHEAIVRRGLSLFDHIYIGVGVNKEKSVIEETAKRVETIRRYYRDLRSVRDFEYERDMADMNRRLTGIETVILFTEPPLAAISSSVVRDLISHGMDVSDLLPH